MTDQNGRQLAFGEIPTNRADQAEPDNQSFGASITIFLSVPAKYDTDDTNQADREKIPELLECLAHQVEEFLSVGRPAQEMAELGIVLDEVSAD